MKRYTRGFTLIELLVVIAIIGILSSVVLVSLSTARSKGNDAKVQAQLSSMRAAAEIYSTNYGSYGTFAAAGCPVGGTSLFGDSTSGMLALVAGNAATAGVGITSCYASGSSWAVAVGLPSAPTATYWCVDSTGKSAKVTGTVAVGTAGSMCPQ